MKKSLLLVLLLSFTSLTALAQKAALADSLRTTGEAFHEKGSFTQAESYYRKAIDVYEQLQDTASLLMTRLYYAEVLAYRAKYDEATVLYNQLLTFDHPSNDNGFKARIQSDLGWLNKKLDKKQVAISHYRDGLELALQANDSLLIGILYNNLGSNTTGEESMNYYKMALPYFRGLGNQRNIAVTLANIGRLYDDFKMYDEALEYFTQSLKMRQELGNIDLLAIIYRSIGNVQQRRGNYRQALIALQKGLEYRKKTGATHNTAGALNNIGALYSIIGDSEKALAYYRRSLELKKDFASDSELVTSYQNIGSRLWDLGEKEEAERYFNRALQTSRAMGDSELLINALLDIFRVAHDKKNYPRAKDVVDEILEIAHSLDDNSSLALGNSFLGSTYGSMGDPKTALTYQKKAHSYSAFLSKREQAGYLIKLAEAYRDVDSDSALIYGKKAYDIIEKMRLKAGAVSELRSSYFDKYSDFYVDLSSWVLYFNSDRDEAYRLVEAAKARTLAEELKLASQPSDDLLPEKLRIEKNKMQNNIELLYTRLERAQEKDKGSLESRISDAELEYEAFLNDLQDRYSDYKKLTVADPVSLEKAQSINDDDTAILEYALSNNKILAFLIHRDGVKVHLTSDTLKSSSLSNYVQNFKNAILNRASAQELEKHSKRLYRLLLQPFEQELKSFTNIIIVPDGPLAYLPFEALRTNGSYLIERFDIKYAPSVTSYTLLNVPDPVYQKQLLAVAGSGVSDNVLTGRDGASVFSALPSTIIEVDSVSSHFDDAEIIKKENITEGALKQTLGSSYRYIHLATHGVIDEEKPRQSGLVLSQPGQLDAFSTEDGMLKSSEIYRLNLNAEMVVLSACNSGIGKYVKGEGMLGLQRSFFHAGTATVVVSLWSVYDRSTAFLMNEFYKEIIAAAPEGGSWYSRFMKWAGWDASISFGQKAKAMKAAKMKLLNHPRYNHPVYWAPFIMVGR